MRAGAEWLILLLWLRLAVFTLLGMLALRRRPGRQPTSEPPARLAVIVPAFNEAEHIAETLQALLAQTRQADELVVVDDGSTDATYTLAVQALSGVPGARVLHLQHNRGKAWALNAGLAATTADGIVTVDADTRLAPDALAQALTGLGRADAAAFHVEVVLTGRWIARLQWQEYAAALNFERRAQSLVGAIAVLPGAACILRRSALATPAFSARTRTEDADITLTLQSRGRRLAVIDAARAATMAPQTVSELARQRVRWLAGHLQCLRHHGPRRGTPLRFRLLTLPNFALSTLTAPLGLAALLVLTLSSQPGWLAPVPAVARSMALVYAQRRLATAPLDGPSFFAEPLVTGSLSLLVFIAAVQSLLRAGRRSRWI